MKLKAKLERISIDYETGKQILSFSASSNINTLDELQNASELDLVITKHREKRSSDANAYFHVLVNKLARKFNVSDEEMKIKMNLQYGTISKDKNGNSIGVKIPKETDIKQFYPYAKWFGECKDNGIWFDKYLFYKQTHTLNTLEMSQLINGVVEECRENGIETKTDNEIKSMLEGWK